jgi:hypothetical protein
VTRLALQELGGNHHGSEAAHIAARTRCFVCRRLVRAGDFRVQVKHSRSNRNIKDALATMDVGLSNRGQERWGAGL